MTFDKNELEKKIHEEIDKRRKLGEHAGRSGHSGFRSIIKFDLKKPKEIIYKGKKAYEIICEYEIFTETEFEYSKEDEIYLTEVYKDKFIVDEELNIL